MNFGLLFVKSKLGVAEAEKGVAAITLFWAVLPGAPYLNLWPRSTIQKPEVLTQVPEMVRNVVKLTVIRKTRVKNRRGQT